MAHTRVFKSGNSQAVRIPAEMAFPDTDIELEIVRTGDVITIYPARPSLKEMVARLRAMPKPPRTEPEPRTDVPDRAWD